MSLFSYHKNGNLFFKVHKSLESYIYFVSNPKHQQLNHRKHRPIFFSYLHLNMRIAWKCRSFFISLLVYNFMIWKSWNGNIFFTKWAFYFGFGGLSLRRFCSNGFSSNHIICLSIHNSNESFVSIQIKNT